MEKINIVIADDHKLFRKGIIALLEDFDFVNDIHEAENGKELLTVLKGMEKLPDLILLDLRMPEMDGVEAHQNIRKLYPEIKVIILTMEDDEQFILHLISEGVNGYLLKNTGKSQLIKSIRAVHHGEIVVDPKIAERYYQRLSQPEKVSFLPELTRREKEILQLISQEKTTAEIAQSLFVSLNTVEYHRKNLLVKFGAKNSVGLIKEALQKGILER